MQLRAISKFGALSATATTNWELRIIIENERGIWSLPITVVANRVLKERLDAGPNSNFYLRPAAFVYAKSDKRARCFLSYGKDKPIRWRLLPLVSDFA